MTVLKDYHIFDANFTASEKIGQGKFGVVSKVKDLNGHVYAAKEIKSKKQQIRDRVLHEIGILSKLDHDHVIRFIDAFEKQGDKITVVTEYLEGGELFERVAGDDFNLTESDCCHYLRQICLAVEYLHRNNILHLDLKPENIVCNSRDGDELKIIDFGMSHEVPPGEKLKITSGTPEFVAPEVVNFDNVAAYTDMWAVGVITYVLLSGYSPFMGDTDQETFCNINRVQYDYDVEEFDTISANAKDFISNLLMKNGRNRLSATQCLEHPWLLEQEISTVILKTEKLKEFLVRRRWQRCGQAIRAMKRMSTIILRRKSTADCLDSDTDAGSESESPTKEIRQDLTRKESATIDETDEELSARFPSVNLR